jgi:hypothetical protein
MHGFLFACNLLNLVFETSNAIHIKFSILYDFKKMGPMFWRRRCGSPTPILNEGLPVLPKWPGRRPCRLEIKDTNEDALRPAKEEGKHVMICILGDTRPQTLTVTPSRSCWMAGRTRAHS